MIKIMLGKIRNLTDISVRTKRSRLPPQKDYREYIFSPQEIAVHIISKAAFLGMVSYLFYDSFIVWLLMLPIAFFTLKKKSQDLCKKRKQQLEMEFREVILSVSSNLQAGYSVENAFREAYQDMALLFGKDSLMAKELYLLQQKLSNNEQLEDILLNLSIRSGVEDIKDFAEIFQIAKRSGGDICSIISPFQRLERDGRGGRAGIFENRLARLLRIRLQDDVERRRVPVERRRLFGILRFLRRRRRRGVGRPAPGRHGRGGLRSAARRRRLRRPAAHRRQPVTGRPERPRPAQQPPFLRDEFRRRDKRQNSHKKRKDRLHHLTSPFPPWIRAYRRTSA